MKIRSSTYPLEISKDEAGLRFQKLVLEGMESEPEFVDLLQGPPPPPVVVARILSSFEVLLKDRDLDGNIEYSHLKFGYSTMTITVPIRGETDWQPVGAPWRDAAMFLNAYGAGIQESHDLPGVFFTVVPFRFRAA